MGGYEELVPWTHSEEHHVGEDLAQGCQDDGEGDFGHLVSLHPLGKEASWLQPPCNDAIEILGEEVVYCDYPGQDKEVY